MGTETKLNCYSENTSSGIIHVPNSNSDLNKTCSSSRQTTTVATAVSPPQACSKNVPFVPMHIDENDVIEGAKQIITSIRPGWNLNFVQYKVCIL